MNKVALIYVFAALGVGLALAFPSSAAFAKSPHAPQTDVKIKKLENKKKCELFKTANLGIRFNNVYVKIEDSVNFIDDRIKEIKEIAAGLGIENLEIQNMDYRVRSSNKYYAANLPDKVQRDYLTLDGNISFILNNEDKATSLMKMLVEKGYVVNFAMRANRRCR